MRLPFFFGESPLMPEEQSKCATFLEKKNISEAPTTASIKQNFYVEFLCYSGSFSPLDFVFKQNAVYIDTINSLLTECT